MARPTRPAGELLFGRRQMLSAAVQGLVLLAAVFGLYLWMIGASLSEETARTTAFVAMVLGNLGLALADASGGTARLFDRRRTTFWIIGAIALLVLALCLLVPPLREILRFEMPATPLLAAALAIGLGTAALARIDLRRTDQYETPAKQANARQPSRRTRRRSRRTPRRRHRRRGGIIAPLPHQRRVEADQEELGQDADQSPPAMFTNKVP